MGTRADMESAPTLNIHNFLAITQKYYDYLVKNNIHMYLMIEDYHESLKFIYKAINKKISEIINLLRVSRKFQEMVSHYTNLDVLNKIISIDKETGIFVEKKFRLSNVIHMNDPEEGKILYDYFNNDELDTKCRNEMIYLPYHLFSFVGGYNSIDNLSMWRTYGKTKQNDADGVSISFKTNIFDYEDINNYPLKNDKDKVSKKFGI